MPDVMVLAHAGDELAMGLGWVLQRLTRRSVRLLSLEELVLSPRLRHTVEGVRGSLSIADRHGQAIDLTAARWVVNRLRHVHVAGREACGRDGDYVTMERFAVLLSALRGLPRVVNRPSASGLEGPLWSPARWLQVASKAGFATPELELVSGARRWPSSESYPAQYGAHYAYAEHASFGTSARSQLRWQEPRGERVELVMSAGDVHALDGRELPGAIAHACRRLGALAACELLQITCAVDAGWTFLAATAHPLELPAASLVRVGRALAENAEEWAS